MIVVVCILLLYRVKEIMCGSSVYPDIENFIAAIFGGAIMYYYHFRKIWMWFYCFYIVYGKC